MAGALQRVGFEVRVARDLSLGAFSSEMASFVKRLRDGPPTIAFFYYSGHGAADRSMHGENFLIPVESEIEDSNALRGRALSLQTVMQAIEAAAPVASFIVLDACRNVAFPSGTKSIAKGLVPQAVGNGTMIAYATKPGDVAADDNIYSTTLAGELEKPGQDALGVFKQTQLKVAAATNQRQVPWLEDGLLISVYFRDGYRGPSVAPPITMDAPRETTAPPGPVVATRYAGLDGRSPIYDTIDLPDASPVRLAIKSTGARPTAEETGQVFGATFDRPAAAPGQVATPSSLYLAATSAYGLPIVDGDSKPLERGRPGATFAPGTFGTKRGGGPGTIWKIDGASGAATVFAEIAPDGRRNGGPALGQLAFDPRTRQIFASDRESGLIHRLSMKGTDLGTFDHGVAGRRSAALPPSPDSSHERRTPASEAFDPNDPATWGLAHPQRRIWGLAIRDDRLFYAVADGPQVWSVGLGIDGVFRDDARLELDVTGGPPEGELPRIAFDRDGNMLVSLLAGPTILSGLGSAKTPMPATLLRYTATTSRPIGGWGGGAQEIGTANADLTGAFAILPRRDGQSGNGGACQEILWAVGSTEGPASTRPSVIGLPLGPYRAGHSEIAAVASRELNGADAVGSLASVDSCERRDAVAQDDTRQPVLGMPRWDVGSLGSTDPDTPPRQSGSAISTQGASTATQRNSTASTQGGANNSGERNTPGGGDTPTDQRLVEGQSQPGAGATQSPPEPAPESRTSPMTAAPACMQFAGARFQCVAGAWELDLFLADALRQPRDSLKISSLAVDTHVSPPHATRVSPDEPFRIRFDKAVPASQIPLDICLTESAAFTGGRMVGCCRGELSVTLPSAVCAPPTVSANPTTSTQSR